MTRIKAIGQLCRIDDEGYIINEADLSKINLKFKDAVQVTIEHFLTFLPNDIHSLYIRGSVPRGLGIEGISDLDTIAITYTKSEELNLDWVDQAEVEINQKFSWLNGVEMSFFHLNDMDQLHRFSIIPFMLKTHSVCVYGEDLKDNLPDYKPDKSLANDHVINIMSQINQAKIDLDGNEDIKDIKDCCEWIMKIIVRTGLALVIVEENTYTRDLYPSYKLFSKHYPQKENEMRKALAYAINPISNSEEIVEFLNHFGEWLVHEAERWLNVYNESKDTHLPLK